MILSSKSLTILKNFGNINPGILFKEGNILRTISPGKNILAIAEIDDEISQEFGIYDLGNFLSVLSMHKDGSTLEFDDKHVYVIGNGGRSKVAYRFCDVSMIDIPPDGSIPMENPEINFRLTVDDLSWIMKAASLLSSPHVAVISDGSKMSIKTFDVGNDAAHTNYLKLDVDDCNEYQMIFNTENLTKILPGSYDVSISSAGVARFTNINENLEYFVAVEENSFWR